MFILGIWALAVVTAVASALPGTFVVLRRQSMLIDGMGHAVFPGIAVGYLLTRDLHSPALIVGAAGAGLAVVVGTEWLARTGLVSGDAPLGLVFPALFAIGVIIVSGQFSSVHLDTHAVLVGDLNLAAFDRLEVAGVDLGPSYLYVMLSLLVATAVFLAAAWPQLTLSTFDPELANVLGISRRTLDTGLMCLVAVTVTAAFHAAGALLVIALVVTPAAAAQIFCTRLPQLVFWTVVIAAGGATAGFFTALVLDVATSAAMAVFYGLVFAGVLAATASGNRVNPGKAPFRDQALPTGPPPA